MACWGNMERRFHLLFFAVVFLWTVKQSSAVDFNITLNLTQLSSGVPNIVIGSSGRLYCLPGQESWYVYVVPADAFSLCSTTNTDFIEVGSCSKDYITVDIITLPIKFPNIPSFESGNPYYFAAYEVSAGSIVSNDPCVEGYKFSFQVVDHLAPDSPMPTSSAVVTQLPSSSILEPVDMSVSPSIYSSFVSTNIYPTVTASVEPKSTADNPVTERPSLPSSTSSDAGNRRPPVTRTTTTSTNDRGINVRPTFTTTTDNIERADTGLNTATISGVGAGVGFIVLVVIILALVIVLVACVLITRNRRELRHNYVYDAHRGPQEKPVATLERSLLQNETGTGHETTSPQPLPPYDLYDSTVVDVTTFNTLDKPIEGGSTSPVMFSQDSIQSATSMDPLLTTTPPVSPTRCNGAPSPSSQLHSIPEDSQQPPESTKQDNNSVNNSTDYKNLKDKRLSVEN